MKQEKDRGPAVKFPVLRLFRPGMGRGSREVRVKPWDPRVEGGAEVSELASGTSRGGGLGAVGGGGGGGDCPHLRRREGGGVRWRLWKWIWSGCKGIGSRRGWAVVRRVKGRRKV